MKLNEKIATLRKQHQMSQENLAEKLDVSRQAISRWEMGSAMPDANNVLQISKLFGVTADYLLNDDFESDKDVPVVKHTEAIATSNIRKILAICVSVFGLFGNLMIYILSRLVEVPVPSIRYENGRKIYLWSGGLTDHSYKYFIEAYDLEFLAVGFWLLVGIGLIYYCRKSNVMSHIGLKCKNKEKLQGKIVK